MWLKWLPWRYIVSRVARSRGFIDPMSVVARLHRFAQPSEVAEPVELLRAGVVFHARGLVNARAIQHNLDWVWPYWVERQFNPHDESFVPRAFSITHVNLTHRNWTAVGTPDCNWLPIVDPRGLLTPLLDGWSLDAWLVPDKGEVLLPSRWGQCSQRLLLDSHLAVETRTEFPAGTLTERVEMVVEDGAPVCRMRVEGRMSRPGWLAVSLRPANPEGVSFIHKVSYDSQRAQLNVDGEARVTFSRDPERVTMSTYRAGDVVHTLRSAPHAQRIACDVGLATVAALFPLTPDTAGHVELRVPCPEAARAMPQRRGADSVRSGGGDWQRVLRGVCQAAVPDARMQMLFDAAVRFLVLHAPNEVYPGPYTYKRFWFRDAAFILNALLVLGFGDRVRRCVERFPSRQTPLGYFRSQEGEWDSNGAALWIIGRYRQAYRAPLSSHLLAAVEKGARWIWRKRLDAAGQSPHAGLMPAGFSAEHLGPNDYYYWDDFWSAAGLRSAAVLLADTGDGELAKRCLREADDLMAAVDRSIDNKVRQPDWISVPASPYRRLDAGAIGSLAASYPLGLWEPRDPRMTGTMEYLLASCMVRGGFFQDMIHSGINPYLTLHMAQVLMRDDDPRAYNLIRSVADLASPTGQWPEAIHPHTLGGCMGDGQHMWAAAEWVLALRAMFVREEPDHLVLGGGLPNPWLAAGHALRFGPTWTRFGVVSVTIQGGRDRCTVAWEATWHELAPRILIRVAGYGTCEAPAGTQQVELSKAQNNNL